MRHCVILENQSLGRRQTVSRHQVAKIKSGNKLQRLKWCCTDIFGTKGGEGRQENRIRHHNLLRLRGTHRNKNKFVPVCQLWVCLIPKTDLGSEVLVSHIFYVSVEMGLVFVTVSHSSIKYRLHHFWAVNWKPHLLWTYSWLQGKLHEML